MPELEPAAFAGVGGQVEEGGETKVSRIPGIQVIVYSLRPPTTKGISFMKTLGSQA